MPGTRETRNAAPSPAASASPGGRPVSICMTRAMITAARPMTKPTERSMPPAMMTKVWPSPSSSGTAANIAMLWTLKPLNRNEMP